MKKIIFLLLLTVAGYSQQTNFLYGIKNPAATIEVSPTMITTHGPTNVYGKVSVNNLPVSIAVQDSLDKKLNISDLPSNLTLYPTTVASDVSGYVVMVTDIHDVRYNTTAVNVSTPSITTTAQLVSSRISDAAVLVGQPGVFNATSFGNIRRLSGSGTANFYFEIYKRTSAGVETLIGVSGNSAPVSSSSYLEFTASLVWDDGTFIDTDRIVVKSYANRISGGTNPVYQFQFGGMTPVRTVLPVPFSVVDAGYEIKTNKANVYTVDGTGEKYYTSDYLNGKLADNYAKIVYVNSTSPIMATIFDLNNPPVTNDNLLKLDTANLYIGTDASTWVYNGSTYITKTIAASSNFKLSSGVDAGNNKTSDIFREGSISTEGSVGSNIGYYVNRNGSNTAQIGGYFNFSNAIGSSNMMFQLNASNGLDLWNYASSTWTKRFTFSSSGDFTANSINVPLTVRKISTNTTLANSDNGKIILLTASATITLPNGLMSGFNCSFSTLAGVTLTYSLGGSVVLLNNLGTTMAEKLSHTIVNTGVSNEYLTAGSL